MRYRGLRHQVTLVSMRVALLPCWMTWNGPRYGGDSGGRTWPSLRTNRLLQVMDAGANRLAAQRAAWSSACGSRGGESKNSLELRTVGHELLQLLMYCILRVA